MRNFLYSLSLAACLFSISATSVCAWARQDNDGRERAASSAITQDLQAGQLLYESRCTYCHGADGRGDGPVAQFLDPVPRDFTSARFKIRSTSRDKLPTDRDLFSAITDGLPGTAMEGWDILTTEERWQLVRYVKTFSRRFDEEEARPIDLQRSVPVGANAVARGEGLFREMKCFLCHGQYGRGDGPITVTMGRVWNMSFDARNLTRADRYKGGNSTEDIFRSISTGLAGTPMDSYEDYMSREERWYLSAYVRSLQTPRVDESNAVLTSRKIAGEIPVEPDDPFWQEIAGLVVPLSGQIITRPRLFNHKVDLLDVKSCFNDNEIAFLLQWDDRTESRQAVFQDAVALQFPTKFPDGPVKPYLLMGEPGNSVNIWQWESSGDTLATEIVAAGPEIVEIQAGTSQHVKARALWEDGRWSVVVRRPLRTGDGSKDTRFETGRLIPVAFSARDGGNKEIGLRQAISSWYYLDLKVPRSAMAYLYALLGMLAAINLELWLVRRT